MWERIALLAFFADICFAQNAALAEIQARQLQAREAIADPIPTMDLEKRQDASVIVTWLFPSAPTEAPTANIVPILVTITGTALAASDVPAGYIVPTDAVTEPGTFLGSLASAPTTNAPTTQPTAAPSTAASTEQSSQTAQSTQQSSTQATTLSTTSKPASSSASPSSSPASSSRATNSASAASASAGALEDANGNGDLSTGAVAGIVIGAVAFVAGLVLMFLFLQRPSKRKSMRAQSPTYPEEAYLYDPPMAAGGAGGAVDPETRSLRAQSFGRPLSRPGTPNMGETAGLLGSAAAAGAAARSRRGTMSNTDSPHLRPTTGGNGYAPVETRDITEMRDVPQQVRFADEDTAYRGSTEAGPSNTSSAWPMNPAADSGLGSPPQSRGGPADAMAALDPVESRSQTPGSMYRDHNPGAGSSSDAMKRVHQAWEMDNH